MGSTGTDVPTVEEVRVQRDDDTEAGAPAGSYEEDALGVPDHTTSTPGRESVPPDEQMPPAERPRGAEAWGTTASEQRSGAPLDVRLAEETPDRPRDADDEGVRLTDDGDPDDTPELTSELGDGDVDDGTAEEAAVHVRNEAPGGTSGPDAYVDEDPRGSAP